MYLVVYTVIVIDKVRHTDVMQEAVSYQKGFCLLEVLVAWCLIVVVALSVFSLEWKSMRHLQAYTLQEVAIIQLNNVAEQLLVANSAVERERTFSVWQHNELTEFPSAKATMDCHDEYCSISLSWFYRSHFSYQLDVRL